MAKKYLSPLNLLNLTSDPGTAAEGDFYWNSSTNRLRIYFDGAWADVSSNTAFTNAANTFTTAQTITPATSLTGLTINAAASAKGLIIKANATTPGNLQEWQNSAGTALAYFASNGQLYLTQHTSIIQGKGITWNNGDNYITGLSGYHIQFTTYDGTSGQNEAMRIMGGSIASGGARVGIGSTAPGSKLQVNTAATGEVGLIVRGIASQTADLIQAQNSAGSVVFKVSPTGVINAGGATTIGNILNFSDPGIGVETKFNFLRATDSAWLAVNEYASDQTYYEFGMSDNPGSGDYYQWRFDEWTAPGHGWMPLQIGAYITRFIAPSITQYGNIALNPYNTPFATVNAAATSAANYTVSRYAPTNGTSYSLNKDTGTGTGTVTLNTQSYTGTNIRNYWIEIETGGTTFKWGIDSSAFGGTIATGVSITGSAQTLDNGLQVTLSTTGHVAGDRWSWQSSPRRTTAIGGSPITGAMQIIYPSAALVGTVIRGASGQTASLQEWQNNSATALAYVSASGNFFIPGIRDTADTGAYINMQASTSGVLVNTRSAANKGLIVKGSTSQSENLTEWQNSSGTILGKITSAGYFGISNLVATNGSTPRLQVSTGTTYNILIEPVSTTTVGLVIKGSASQTGNLQEWQDSNTNILASVSSSGAFTVASLTVSGDLTVNGTTTNINTTNLVVEDKNIILGDVTTPSNTTADGGGITLKGATDKTFNWVNATGSWTSSEPISAPRLLAGTGSLIGESALTINGTAENDDAQLIIKKPSQSLASIMAWNGQVYYGANVYYNDAVWIHDAPSGDTNNSLMAQAPGTGMQWWSSNNSSGSWNVANGVTLWDTTGAWKTTVNTGNNVTAAAFIPTSSTIPTNGMYLPAANTIGFATNSTSRIQINSIGETSIGGTPSGGTTLAILRSATGSTSMYGIYSTETAASDVTSLYTSIRGRPRTAAASFTLGSAISFESNDIVKGAGSTVTNHIHYYVNATTTSASNVYGFRSDLNAAANVYNLYMNGTAANYFAGQTAIGSPAYSMGSGGVAQMLGVTSSSATNIGIVVRGAASQTADLQQWQDSSGTNLVRINATGQISTSNVIVVGTLSGSIAQASIYTTGASGIGIAVRGFASQTADLQQWQNNSGTVLANITSGGDANILSTITIGTNRASDGASTINFNTVTGQGSSQASIYRGGGYNGSLVLSNFGSSSIINLNGSAASVNTIIRGATSQTADLQQWQNSAGSVLTSIQSNGTISSSAGIYAPSLNNISTSANSNIQMEAGGTRIGTSVATNISLIIRNTNASPTGNLTEWQTPAGTAVATMSPSGAFSAVTKSFDIEHPTKEGMRLRYGSLEGPENGVYIRGRSKQDYIALPDHWRGLVDEDTITVNITPVGKKQDIYVDSIEDNKVYLGGKIKEYFFTVYGERKDVDKLLVEY